MPRITLLALVLLSACTFTDIPPPTYAFDGPATLDAPEVVRVGVPFRVTVDAQPRLEGAGYVALRAAVDQIQVLSPVRDTVTFGVGTRAVTDSVRVALVPGERVRQTWTVVVEDLPDVSILNPHLGAYVQMDSVRLDDGRLVALDSEEGWEAFANSEGVDSRARTGDIPIRVSR